LHELFRIRIYDHFRIKLQFFCYKGNFNIRPVDLGLGKDASEREKAAPGL